MPILADHKTNEMLTDHEHEVLSGLLTLLRDESQWVPYFLYVLGRRSGDRSRPVTHKSVMEEVLAAYDDEPTNPESLEGVLMIKDPIGDSYHEIDDNEFKALSHYLKVIRAGGWLADRMSLEFDMFAEGRRYTPGEVIQHLTDFAIEDFQENVDDAKNMIRDYPQLFQEDLQAPGAAVAHVDPVEPAAPEAGPAPSAPQPIAPQRRTRKRTSGKAPMVASK